jgi:predicted porin
VGATYTAGDLGFGVIYLHSDLDTDYSKNGWVGTISYAGADAEKPGSWGLVGKYYNQGAGTFIAHTMDGTPFVEGFKGYSIGANYAVAKNMIANVVYYDTKSKETDAKSKVIWSEMDFTF